MKGGALLGRVVATLSAAEVPFMLTGSVAAAYHGAPRATVDIDVAIVLRAADVPALLAGLGPEFYVDEGAMRQAVARHSSFNAIHLATMEAHAAEPALIAVVTRDRRIAENARAMGYLVE